MYAASQFTDCSLPELWASSPVAWCTLLLHQLHQHTAATPLHQLLSQLTGLRDPYLPEPHTATVPTLSLFNNYYIFTV